jgi:hypothetical protein
MKGQEVSSLKALLEVHGARLSTIINADKAADRAFKQVGHAAVLRCRTECGCNAMQGLQVSLCSET